MNPANHDLRAFVKEIESIGQLHRIQGVPWDKDMGGLVEMILERSKHARAMRPRNFKPPAVMDTSVIEEVRKSGFIDKLYGRAPKNER